MGIGDHVNACCSHQESGVILHVLEDGLLISEEEHTGAAKVLGVLPAWSPVLRLPRDRPHPRYLSHDCVSIDRSGCYALVPSCTECSVVWLIDLEHERKFASKNAREVLDIYDSPPRPHADPDQSSHNAVDEAKPLPQLWPHLGFDARPLMRTTGVKYAPAMPCLLDTHDPLGVLSTFRGPGGPARHCEVLMTRFVTYDQSNKQNDLGPVLCVLSRWMREEPQLQVTFFALPFCYTEEAKPALRPQLRAMWHGGFSLPPVSICALSLASLTERSQWAFDTVSSVSRAKNGPTQICLLATMGSLYVVEYHFTLRRARWVQRIIFLPDGSAVPQLVSPWVYSTAVTRSEENWLSVFNAVEVLKTFGDEPRSYSAQHAAVDESEVFTVCQMLSNYIIHTPIRLEGPIANQVIMKGHWPRTSELQNLPGRSGHTEKLLTLAGRVGSCEVLTTLRRSSDKVWGINCGWAEQCFPRDIVGESIVLKGLRIRGPFLEVERESGETSFVMIDGRLAATGRDLPLEVLSSELNAAGHEGHHHAKSSGKVASQDIWSTRQLKGSEGLAPEQPMMLMCQCTEAFPDEELTKMMRVFSEAIPASLTSSNLIEGFRRGGVPCGYIKRLTRLHETPGLTSMTRMEFLFDQVDDIGASLGATEGDHTARSVLVSWSPDRTGLNIRQIIATPPSDPATNWQAMELPPNAANPPVGLSGWQVHINLGNPSPVLLSHVDRWRYLLILRDGRIILFQATPRREDKLVIKPAVFDTQSKSLKGTLCWQSVRFFNECTARVVGELVADEVHTLFSYYIDLEGRTVNFTEYRVPDCSDSMGVFDKNLSKDLIYRIGVDICGDEKTVAKLRARVFVCQWDTFRTDTMIMTEMFTQDATPTIVIKECEASLSSSAVLVKYEDNKLIMALLQNDGLHIYLIDYMKGRWISEDVIPVEVLPDGPLRMNSFGYGVITLQGDLPSSLYILKVEECVYGTAESMVVDCIDYYFSLMKITLHDQENVLSVQVLGNSLGILVILSRQATTLSTHHISAEVWAPSPSTPLVSECALPRTILSDGCLASPTVAYLAGTELRKVEHDWVIGGTLTVYDTMRDSAICTLNLDSLKLINVKEEIQNPARTLHAIAPTPASISTGVSLLTSVEEHQVGEFPTCVAATAYKNTRFVAIGTMRMTRWNNIFPQYCSGPGRLLLYYDFFNDDLQSGLPIRIRDPSVVFFVDRADKHQRAARENLAAATVCSEVLFPVRHDWQTESNLFWPSFYQGEPVQMLCYTLHNNEPYIFVRRLRLNTPTHTWLPISVLSTLNPDQIKDEATNNPAVPADIPCVDFQYENESEEAAKASNMRLLDRISEIQLKTKELYFFLSLAEIRYEQPLQALEFLIQPNEVPVIIAANGHFISLLRVSDDGLHPLSTIPVGFTVLSFSRLSSNRVLSIDTLETDDTVDLSRIPRAWTAHEEHQLAPPMGQHIRGNPHLLSVVSLGESEGFRGIPRGSLVAGINRADRTVNIGLFPRYEQADPTKGPGDGPGEMLVRHVVRGSAAPETLVADFSDSGFRLTVLGPGLTPYGALVGLKQLSPHIVWVDWADYQFRYYGEEAFKRHQLATLIVSLSRLQWLFDWRKALALLDIKGSSVEDGRQAKGTSMASKRTQKFEYAVDDLAVAIHAQAATADDLALLHSYDAQLERLDRLSGRKYAQTRGDMVRRMAADRRLQNQIKAEETAFETEIPDVLERWEKIKDRCGYTLDSLMRLPAPDLNAFGSMSLTWLRVFIEDRVTDIGAATSGVAAQLAKNLRRVEKGHWGSREEVSNVMLRHPVWEEVYHMPPYRERVYDYGPFRPYLRRGIRFMETQPDRIWQPLLAPNADLNLYAEDKFGPEDIRAFLEDWLAAKGVPRVINLSEIRRVSTTSEPVWAMFYDEFAEEIQGGAALERLLACVCAPFRKNKSPIRIR